MDVMAAGAGRHVARRNAGLLNALQALGVAGAGLFVVTVLSVVVGGPTPLWNGVTSLTGDPTSVTSDTGAPLGSDSRSRVTGVRPGPASTAVFSVTTSPTRAPIIELTTTPSVVVPPLVRPSTPTQLSSTTVPVAEPEPPTPSPTPSTPEPTPAPTPTPSSPDPTPTDPSPDPVPSPFESAPVEAPSE